MKLLSGPVEIAKLEGRKFFFEDIDHLSNAHPLSSSHGLEIEVWINIEVSHLDEVKVCLLDQPYQPFHFVLSVCEPWEHKEIN